MAEKLKPQGAAKCGELSLRPYNGRLFVARTRKDYERMVQEIFKHPDALTIGTVGRFNAGEGKDGLWTYLVWASSQATLAHEISHVILHVFQRVGIDPRECGGEPFCYLLSQLMMEAATGAVL